MVLSLHMLLPRDMGGPDRPQPYHFWAGRWGIQKREGVVVPRRVLRKLQIRVGLIEKREEGGLLLVSQNHKSIVHIYPPSGTGP